VTSSNIAPSNTKQVL